MIEKSLHELEIPSDTRFWSGVNISYSLIQALKQEHCPFAVFHISIAKTISQSNINMTRGQYFESQVLGETAKGDVITDLPRLKSGEKNVDHKRIDEQVNNFKNIAHDHNIKFITKQLRLEFKDPNYKYKLVGVIDAVGTITDEDQIKEWIRMQTNNIFREPGEDLVDVNEVADRMRKSGTPAIFDLKLTKSITKSTGDWSWKHPYNMPTTQPAILTKLMMDVMNKKYPFYYLVFDYSEEQDHVIVRKEITQLELGELGTDIRDTETKLDYYRQNGFDYNPEYYRCKECPLFETCPSAITIKPIIKA